VNGYKFRGKVDEKGKRLSDEVNRAFGRYDFDGVLRLGGEIRDWLAGEGQSASRSVRGSLYALLADVAVIAASRDAAPDYNIAFEYYRQALGAYGGEISAKDRSRILSLRAKLDYLSGIATRRSPPWRGGPTRPACHCTSRY
jgi:hypothetical protein